MNWSEWLLLCACLGAALGVHLNVSKDRRCFHLWLVSNTIQIAFALWLFWKTGHKGAIWNAVLFGYYWVQSARGLWTWKAEPEKVRIHCLRCIQAQAEMKERFSKGLVYIDDPQKPEGANDA